MNCPYCDAKTQVTNSRSHNNSSGVWRRRACVKCRAIWTTHETIDLSTSHRVRTFKNDIRPISRDKLFVSIKDSCAHRKTALADASALTDTVLSQILALKQPIIEVSHLATTTHQTLSRFDPIAAAVYGAQHSIN